MKTFDYSTLSEHAKQTVFDSLTASKIPFFVMENDKMLFANPAWLSFASEFHQDLEAGCSLYQSLEKEIHRLAPHFTDAEKQSFAQNFFEIMTGGQHGDYETKDGRLFRGFYSNDAPGLVSGLSFDLSDLQDKRDEANKMRSLLEVTLDGLQQGVLLYDRDGQVIYVNKIMRVWSEDTGIDLQKGMEQNQVTAQMQEKVLESINKEKSQTNFEIIQTVEDGRTFLIESRALDGIGTLVSAVDISELQDALEAAKSADKAKTSFLANMSHEIRTPMNGVLGMAQVLEQMDINEDQKSCIKIIKQSSEMLLSIINDILDISKLDAKKVELEIEPFYLNELVQSALDIIRPESAHKDLDLILDFDNTDYSFLGDSGKIRQILLNLLSNAVKFTQKGYVKLTVTVDDIVTFSVEDSGIGIEADKIETIFERFEQSDNSTTREYGGTGLGLAISKSLSDLMNGKIRAQSTYGQGTVFELKLPLDAVDYIQETARPINFRDFKDTPILVIDDLEVNHMVIANQLKPLKLNPYFVKSAEKGLHVIRTMAARGYQIPLVICDYQMPDKNGYDFVKALKGDPAIADIPVIILSSADIIARKRDFIEIGVSNVFEKPINSQTLIKTVSQCLSQGGLLNRPNIKLKPPKRPKPTQKKPISKHILVADDDPINREVFRGLLKLLGHESTIVDNGLQAVQAYSQNSFDLIVMDISMPVLNGMEATQKIIDFEHHHNMPHTPVIAVTAHALKGDKDEFLSSGMDDYLAKPVRKADFEIVLNKWLAISEKRKNSKQALAS